MGTTWTLHASMTFITNVYCLLSCLFAASVDLWKDDNMHEVYACKWSLWQKFDDVDESPECYMMAELRERHIFELSNLFYLFSNKVWYIQSCYYCIMKDLAQI